MQKSMRLEFNSGMSTHGTRDGGYSVFTSSFQNRQYTTHVFGGIQSCKSWNDHMRESLSQAWCESSRISSRISTCSLNHPKPIERIWNLQFLFILGIRYFTDVRCQTRIQHTRVPTLYTSAWLRPAPEAFHPLWRLVPRGIPRASAGDKAFPWSSWRSRHTNVAGILVGFSANTSPARELQVVN